MICPTRTLATPVISAVTSATFLQSLVQPLPTAPLSPVPRSHCSVPSTCALPQVCGPEEEEEETELADEEDTEEATLEEDEAGAQSAGQAMEPLRVSRSHTNPAVAPLQPVVLDPSGQRIFSGAPTSRSFDPSPSTSPGTARDAPNPS